MGSDKESFWPTKMSDLAVAYLIMQKYADLQNGQLPLFVQEQTEGLEEKQNRLTLPPWVEVLALTLKAIHGDIYYPFILDRVIGEIGMGIMVAKGIPENNIKLFQTTVRAGMIDKAATVH